MKITTLPDGARGIDVNGPINAISATRFVDKGFTFACRYVRRAAPHDYDLSITERDTILHAGLGLMIVQHVAAPGWDPTLELGHSYGAVARLECIKAGILPGTHVWCDLEGVGARASTDDVVEYCNAWHDELWNDGYQPGLYFGDACGLSAHDLYTRLKFRSYWSAYNANLDTYPIVRGAQMYQHAAKAEDLIPGYTNQNMDVDVIRADALGGSPSVCVA